jgi:hypothetical protein
MTPPGEPVTPLTKKARWGDWIPKLLLFVVSLVIFMEAGARLFFSLRGLRLLGDNDSSHRLYWIALQRFRPWIELYDVYHPTRGWALKPDIKEMNVFGKIVSSNSKGLRGKGERGYLRTAGRQRIVVLGDSFTFGEAVSDDETYSHQLESVLPNTEVLNLGVHGYGHDQMLLYLKEEGVKYHPDVVLLGFVYIDIYRNLLTFYAYAKPRFRLVSGGLQLTNVPVPAPGRVRAQEPYRSKALDVMVILRESLRWRLGKREKEARDLTRLLLDEIIVTTRSIGAVPVFVYLPTREEIDNSSDSLTGREQFLDDYCRERGIPCLFLRLRFHEEIKRGVQWGGRYHWPAKLHQVAAEAIKDFLLGSNLIQNGSASGVGSKTPARVELRQTGCGQETSKDLRTSVSGCDGHLSGAGGLFGTVPAARAQRDSATSLRAVSHRLR